MNKTKKVIRKSGGTAQVARELGVSMAVVSNWIGRDSIPPEYIIPLERMSGVHRSLINPAIYPPSEYK